MVCNSAHLVTYHAAHLISSSFRISRMRGAALRALGVLSALTLLVGRVKGQAKVKPVTTHLSAKWFDTPLLLEASEFMAEESVATFWGFVEALAEVDSHTYSKSKCFA